MTHQRFSTVGAFSLAVAMGSACHGDGASTTDDGPGDDAATLADDSGDDAPDGSASADGPDSGVDDASDAGDDADTGGSTDDGSSDSGGIQPGECGAIATFEDGLAPTAEIHVATDGSDGGGCGSMESPCATIEGAAAQAAPVTAIRVHAGTYAGGMNLAGLAGSEGAPIWIGGAPVWFAQDAPEQSDPGLPVPESDGLVGVDPMLGEDRSIGADSPAAGAGLVVRGLRGDHRGECWGEPPSIGAFEVGG